jgi:hypothetical protein
MSGTTILPIPIGHRCAPVATRPAAGGNNPYSRRNDDRPALRRVGHIERKLRAPRPDFVAAAMCRLGPPLASEGAVMLGRCVRGEGGRRQGSAVALGGVQHQALCERSMPWAGWTADPRCSAQTRRGRSIRRCLPSKACRRCALHREADNRADRQARFRQEGMGKRVLRYAGRGGNVNHSWNVLSIWYTDQPSAPMNTASTMMPMVWPLMSGISVPTTRPALPAIGCVQHQVSARHANTDTGGWSFRYPPAASAVIAAHAAFARLVGHTHAGARRAVLRWFGRRLDTEYLLPRSFTVH